MNTQTEIDNEFNVPTDLELHEIASRAYDELEVFRQHTLEPLMSALKARIKFGTPVIELKNGKPVGKRVEKGQNS